MKRTLAALAVVLASAASLAAETVSITLPSESVALAPGPGVDQTQTQCRMCHSLDYITTQPPVSAAQWEGVVTKMIKVYGAPLSEADARIISEYLVRHYGAGR